MNNEPFQKHDIFHDLIPEKKNKIDNHGKEDDSTA